MDYNWEEFDEGPTPTAKGAFYVTLTDRRRLYLNGPVIEALGNPDGVTLMYDRRRSTIGLRSSPLNRRSTYKLRKKDKTNSLGRVISIANFCQRHHICPDGTVLFTAAELTKDGILALDLNEIRTVQKQTKKRASERRDD